MFRPSGSNNYAGSGSLGLCQVWEVDSGGPLDHPGARTGGGFIGLIKG